MNVMSHSRTTDGPRDVEFSTYGTHGFIKLYEHENESPIYTGEICIYLGRENVKKDLPFLDRLRYAIDQAIKWAREV